MDRVKIGLTLGIATFGLIVGGAFFYMFARDILPFRNIMLLELYLTWIVALAFVEPFPRRWVGRLFGVHIEMRSQGSRRGGWVVVEEAGWLFRLFIVLLGFLLLALWLLSGMF